MAGHDEWPLVWRVCASHGGYALGRQRAWTGNCSARRAAARLMFPRPLLIACAQVSEHFGLREVVAPGMPQPGSASLLDAAAVISQSAGGSPFAARDRASFASNGTTGLSGVGVGGSSRTASPSVPAATLATPNLPTSELLAQQQQSLARMQSLRQQFFLSGPGGSDLAGGGSGDSPGVMGAAGAEGIGADASPALPAVSSALAISPQLPLPPQRSSQAQPPAPVSFSLPLPAAPFLPEPAAVEANAGHAVGDGPSAAAAPHAIAELPVVAAKPLPPQQAQHGCTADLQLTPGHSVSDVAGSAAAARARQVSTAARALAAGGDVVGPGLPNTDNAVGPGLILGGTAAAGAQLQAPVPKGAADGTAVAQDPSESQQCDSSDGRSCLGTSASALPSSRKPLPLTPSAQLAQQQLQRQEEQGMAMAGKEASAAPAVAAAAADAVTMEAAFVSRYRVPNMYAVLAQKQMEEAAEEARAAAAAADGVHQAQGRAGGGGGL